MPFTQETFLGASITNFRANLGWGTQVSTLTVSLVEDPTNGDDFSPGSVGEPVYFDYQDWTFGGLLQSYRQTYGESGNPTYEVQVQDPRDLLSGVQLILQDYTGSTYGVSNLYNIYGYLETTNGFGGSLSNDSGIPWYLVRDAFTALQATTPISFRGHSYVFTAFAGITLPDYYRIPGDSIDLLEFVNNICAAISCDYFVTLVRSGVINYITVNLVNRSYQPTLGKIDEFITSVDNVTSKEQGYELRNETSSKFVVGGQVSDVYFQNYIDYGNDEEDTTDGGGPKFEDNTIWPYWGYDAQDKLIIGKGDFNSDSGLGHTFTLDGRSLYLETGIKQLINYKSDIAEMRAARAGQEAWESFLVLHSSYPESRHYRKAYYLNLTGGQNTVVKEFLTGRKRTGIVAPFRGSSVAAMSATQSIDNKENYEAKRARNIRIYDFVRKYATEYYGKKFMVRIPFVLGKIEPDTNKIVLSMQPTDGGFIPEEYWAGGATNGYMPYDISSLTLQDGRIQGYVKFINSKIILDNDGNRLVIKSDFTLDKLSRDDYVLEQYPDFTEGKMRENLFVKCTLDPNLFFINNSTLFSPRVVITLAGPISDNSKIVKKLTMSYFDDLKEFLLEEPTLFDVTKATKMINMISTQFGNDHLNLAKDANMQIPDMAALPLKSNILTYGPWYASGSSGKVEYEKNESFVPWNFGNYDTMNLAGAASVEDAFANQQVSETGSIEVAGVPSVQLGRVLISGGPYVTDVSVSIDAQGGATTTYSMSTWEYKFGRLGKYNVERFQKLSKLAQQQRRTIRKLLKYPEPLNVPSRDHIKTDLLQLPRDIKPESSATIIGGDVLVSNLSIAPSGAIPGSGDSSMTVTTNIATLAPYRLQAQISNDSYTTKAGVSLEGMFTPFTTKTDDIFITDPSNNYVIPPSSVSSYISYLPHFEEPTADAVSPTVTNLNPFSTSTTTGMEAVVFPETEEIENNLSSEFSGYVGDVKSIAIKSPIIVGGWGYDTDGNPVPSGGDGQFIPNYKQRADRWKVGPVDLRWDNSKKLWVTGGGSSGGLKIGKLNSNLFPNGMANVTVWQPTSSGSFEATSEIIYNARDWLLPDSSMLSTGTKVTLEKTGSYWIVTGAKRPC